MALPRKIAALMVLTLGSCGLAHAAPKAYLTVDHSTEAVMDEATAQSVWVDKMPAQLNKRLFKLYPTPRWGFVSQVEGGFTADKVCVITARAMLMPRSGKVLSFKPSKTATAFDAQAGATQAQCKALAKAKLGEAIEAVLSSLVGR